MIKSTKSNSRGMYIVHDKKQLVSIGKIFNNALFEVHKQSLELAVKTLFTYILQVLQSQSYDWAPLNPEYKRRKEKKGLSGKILIATGDYYNAIKYEITSDAVWVGVPNKIHKPSGLNYNILARVHEFGSETMKIPARPLWRPALSWWIREWNSTHKRNLIKNVNKKLNQNLKEIGDYG